MLLMLLVVSIVYEVKFKVKANPKTITVPDDYPTIQDAINAANPEDVVYVKAGTYNENIVVDKTLSLIGEDANRTIIDGNRKNRDVVKIKANSVTFKGFTIRNSGAESSSNLIYSIPAGVRFCLLYTSPSPRD